MAYTITMDKNETQVDGVGPCGCEVCEKWADCDYCDGCNPE